MCGGFAREQTPSQEQEIKNKKSCVARAARASFERTKADLHVQIAAEEMHLRGGKVMGRAPSRLMVIVAAALVLGGMALAAQDKYTVQVPNGLAFSEFRGYEDWPVVAVSQPEGKLNVIVANPAMIEAYRAGVPGNGQPFPDGSMMAKIAWKPIQSEEAPFEVSVPDDLMGIGFMVKDSQRFPDTGGWGWAQFDYDPASDTFTPNTSQQENDAACGFACHSIAEAKDFVFTAYGTR